MFSAIGLCWSQYLLTCQLLPFLVAPSCDLNVCVHVVAPAPCAIAIVCAVVVVVAVAVPKVVVATMCIATRIANVSVVHV